MVVGPVLNTVQLFNSVLKSTQILDHTFLTQYSNGSCGSISITTDGIFELANVLPQNVIHLCNEDTDLIVNEREIGVFYFKKHDGNIDQVICNNGMPKPQIIPEVDPEPDMELPLDMTVDMEAQIDPDMIIDMDTPRDMELDMNLPLDMTADMEVQIDPDMQIDMEASRDMESDMELILDRTVDMETEDDFDKDKDKDQEGSNTKRKSKSSGCSVESNDSQNLSLLFLMGLLSLKRLRRSKDTEI